MTSFKLFHHQISLSQHYDASCDNDDDTDNDTDDHYDDVTWHWVPVGSISIDRWLCW